MIIADLTFCQQQNNDNSVANNNNINTFTIAAAIAPFMKTHKPFKVFYMMPIMITMIMMMTIMIQQQLQ